MLYYIVPPVSVSIIESQIPTFQQSHTLRCILNAPSSLTLTSLSYSWQKNGETLTAEMGSQLRLSALQESDNNTDYRCRYMASSQYLIRGINVTSTTHRLIIKGVQINGLFWCTELFSPSPLWTKETYDA